MAQWPLRRQLLVIPIATVALGWATVLWLLAGPGVGAMRGARMAVLLLAASASLALLYAAWRLAGRLAQRIHALRETLGHWLNRSNAGARDAGTAAAAHDHADIDAGTGDEVQRLANRLHQAIFRGRERDHQMRRSSEFLEFAQAAGGFGVFDLDLVTGQMTGTPLFFELLSLAATQVPFTRDEWLATVHPNDYESVVMGLGEAIAAAGRFQTDYRSLRQSAGARWLCARGQVLRDAEGFPARAIGTVTDITHLKQAERAALDAKLAAEEARLTAETANLAKSHFLANVSHEIRTPMNGVIGMTEMLAETRLTHAQRECVDIVRGSAQALLALINDVLDLSKIEAGRLDLECVVFNLRDVVYEAIPGMALQAAHKGIELVVDTAASALVNHGDPGRFRQIVLNLLGNAIKFTHEGSVVVKLANENGIVRLEVTDTGIGIPADRVDRLFQTFSQVDSSTTRHYGGSGLGLSIVKRLAERMGGAVGMSSLPGQGSTFWVTIPMEPALEQPVPHAVGVGKRILIVDDLAASRASLANKLRPFGFECLAVADVDAALAELGRDPGFSLVLADELMPGRDGLDLLDALRRDPRFARLPFVLMCLFGTEHADPRAQRPDAVAFKPIRGSKLAAVLKGVFTGASPQLTAEPERPSELPTFRGRRILLVEDNPVNQRVARRVLQRLAVETAVANNGAEALEHIAENTFDAVLMDCQMPVMDGFTAARRIRAQEAQSGARRLPIIALTANVMVEDRDRCLAAGMDAHLGKPLEPSQLANCLGRYLTADSAPTAIDLPALRELTGGDVEFERELIDTFIRSGDACLAEILAALRASDLETIGRRAHALKGASANIHARPLSAAASQLEHAARANSLGEIDTLVRQLGEQLRAVNAQLKAS